MAQVSDVFNIAMSLMDELSSTGEAQTSNTTEYQNRTPAIINVLVAEVKMLTGDTTEWLPVESIDDLVPGVSANYALGSLPYGLAANLLVDENPRSAGYYQQRYEELRAIFIAKQTANNEQIEDVYGGIGMSEESRW